MSIPVFLALLLWSAQLTPAQPALARVEAVPLRAAKAGTSVKLVVNVTPREGIHIYAPPQKQFKPISLTIDAAPGMKVGKVQLPASVSRTFEGESVNVYDRPFSIAIPVALPGRAGTTASVKGKLLYQACDDLVCYRPVTITLRWAIQLQ